MGIFLSKFGKMRWEKCWPADIYGWSVDFVHKQSQWPPVIESFFQALLFFMSLMYTLTNLFTEHFSLAASGR